MIRPDGVQMSMVSTKVYDTRPTEWATEWQQCRGIKRSSGQHDMTFFPPAFTCILANGIKNDVCGIKKKPKKPIT